jgi:hypothetical protein
MTEMKWNSFFLRKYFLKRGKMMNLWIKKKGKETYV